MKTVEIIELALESTSAAAAGGKGKGGGGGTVGQPIDLYADPLRVAAALVCSYNASDCPSCPVDTPT